MEKNRNDACPCGSGKKYKKCCMNQDHRLQVGQVQQDRFFQTKHELTNRVRDFILDQLSYQDMLQLQKEYKRRSGSHSLDEDGMFQFWFMFLHRFPNGLCGVEWFSDRQGSRVSRELKTMLQVWIGLVPRFIQIVDYNDEGVLAEDIVTKERMPMPYAPTMPNPIPWGGAFCLLEEMGGGYYINGIALIVGPRELENGTAYLKKLLEETKQSYEQVVREHYLELLQVMRKPTHGIKERRLIDLEETTLYYKILHEDQVFQQFMKDPAFSFDYLSKGEAEISLVGGWTRYEDNAIPAIIYSAPVYASIQASDRVLQFTSTDIEKTKLFMGKMKAMQHAIRFSHEETSVKRVPEGISLQTYSIRSEQEIPPQFGLIVQEVLSLYDESMRLPFLHNLSLEEAVNQGYSEEVEAWLRQREFSSYRLRGADSTITADYNTIRRQLGLSPSPFITMQNARETKLTAVADPFAHPLSVKEEDIQLYEALQFEPEAVHSFFADDIVQFFKEKALNKSEGTYYKYRSGLTVIVGYLTSLRVFSWGEVTVNHWRELLSYHYLKEHEDASLNQLKAVLNTVKAFVKWLDKQYGSQAAPAVIGLIQELEPKLHNAIAVWNYYAPSSQRKYVPSILQTGFALLSHIGEQSEGMEEGLFQIQKITSTGMTMEHTEDHKAYQVATPVSLRKLVEKGMLIAGIVIKPIDKKQWKLAAVERVFPPQGNGCL